MSEEFEDRVRSWLRERGRTDRELLASVAGHVAVLPPRRPNRRRPLVVIAATLVLAVVALYALLPQVGQVASPDTSDSPRPPGTVIRYVGDGFTFDFPATWRVISESEHVGLHGPTVAAAVGTGDLDLGCVTTPPSGGDLGGVGCPAEPRWDVPDDGVVVAYWARAHLGTPWATPTLVPGAAEHWESVGGRPATAHDDRASPVWRWRVEPEPWVIEARFGPAASEATRAAVRALVASWRWKDEAAAPTVTPQPTPEPTPAWAADVVGNLACEGEVAPIGAGGSPGDIAGGSEAGSAKSSLDAFLAGDARYYATLPLANYELVEQSPSWALYAHLFEGRNRAVALFHDDGQSWSLWQVAACDPVEFDPAAPLSFELEFWTDVAGNRLPTTSVSDRADCYGGTRLRVAGRLFVADPRGSAYDPTRLHGTYGRLDDLPPDAVDTGYRSGDRRLFLAADELAAFVVTPTGVERWPRVRGDEYDRTDCN